VETTEETAIVTTNLVTIPNIYTAIAASNREIYLFVATKNWFFQL